MTLEPRWPMMALMNVDVDVDRDTVTIMITDDSMSVAMAPM